MVDVLLQFLGTDFAHDFAQSSKRARGSREPDDMYWLSKNVKALWKVIPALPPLLSYTLLDCLPEPPHSPIPTEVIEALDEGQLGHLLTRDEITLKELRRKIYEECANNALCRSAVSSQHFELLDSDITALALATESEQSSKRVEKIIVLAESCGGATLVQMEAIGDFFIAQRDKKSRRRLRSQPDSGAIGTGLGRYLRSTRLGMLLRKLKPTAQRSYLPKGSKLKSLKCACMN